MDQVILPFMIDKRAHDEALKRLEIAEQEHGVRVLFAIESGSRAWGFASPDSDYDVRFVYIHPTDYYLSIDVAANRDVIEYPLVNDMDISGWDIRKALNLMAKSNPSLVEWLQSPIVYRQQEGFRADLLGLLESVYSPLAGSKHYFSMAKSNEALLRRGMEEGTVKLKKYFYILRALLAARWILDHRSIPPIEFGKLVDLIRSETEVMAEIEALLAVKKVTSEVGAGSPNQVLDTFIAGQLEWLEEAIATLERQTPARHVNNDFLNEFFRSTLKLAVNP